MKRSTKSSLTRIALSGRYQYALLLFVSVALGCNTTKFPVSDVVPGAHISVTNKTDSDGNHIIKIKSDHLASPERLDPPKNIYVIWADTGEKGIMNLGKLDSDSSGKSKFETTTSFAPKEIFITAEEDGAVEYPSGTEITRVSVE